MVATSVNSEKHILGKVIKHIILSIVAVCYILPLVWILNVSFKTNEDFIKRPFNLPDKFVWENYYSAFIKARLGIATLNSFIVCTCALVLSLAVSSMAAYVIARMRFTHVTKIAKMYFMIGMMIPIHCLLIPLFHLFKSFGMLNTLQGVILPYTVFTLPITIFILTGFFKGLSREFFESACIDGCSIYSCFYRIGLPLVRNGLFVTGLMGFVSNWNEMILGTVFLSDKNLKTIPVAITAFKEVGKTHYTQMFAAIMVSIFPTIIVYCMFSNRIVDGLTQGALKS